MFRILPFLILALAVPAQAQVYKWVDANGKIQYSDNPPPESKKPALIRSGPPADAKPAPPTDWQARDRDYRSRKIMQDDAGRREEQVRAAQAEECRRARYWIDKAGVPVFRVNEKGERVFLEDAELAARVQTARQYVAQHCQG
jgi:hypothetical protein